MFNLNINTLHIKYAPKLNTFILTC